MVREGEPTEGIYFVRRGRVKVCRIVNGESTLLRFGVGPTVVGDGRLHGAVTEPGNIVDPAAVRIGAVAGS